MTTIAFDGTTLAADRSVCRENSSVGECTKVFHVREFLVGITGDLVEGDMLLQWFLDGAVPKDFPSDLTGEGHLHVIDQAGQIRVYSTKPTPATFRADKFAAGSGQAYARAAMACGKNAAGAVAIATQFDLYTGGGIDCLRFPTPFQAAVNA